MTEPKKKRQRSSQEKETLWREPADVSRWTDWSEETLEITRYQPEEDERVDEAPSER